MDYTVHGIIQARILEKISLLQGVFPTQGLNSEKKLLLNMGFMVTQTVKNPPTMQETWVQFLDWEDPLEEGMATHSRILAC